MRILALAGRQFEGQHGAETTLLPRGDGVAGMVGQAGVVDACHGRMRIQQGHDRGGVLLVRAQACIQGAQAAQGQEGIERRTGQAQRVAPPHQLLVHRRVARDHRAAHHVTVAVDVLGGRMQHHVGTERQRLLQGRRQEGVVHHHQRTGLVRGIDDEAQVGDAQQRVGRRFHQHQLRLAGQRLGQRTRVGEVGGDQGEVALLRQCIEQAPAATVRIVRHHQGIARLQQCVQHQVDRAHAGGGDDAASAAFQFGQCFAQQVAGRVAAARVVVLPLVAEAIETEVGRQHDRRGDRTVGGVAVDAGADSGSGAATGRLVGVQAHADSPEVRKAVARIASMRSVSLRKASWP